MNRNELNKEFRALAHSYPRQASERVEQRLIVEFRRRQRRRVWLPAAALAACLAIAFGCRLWLLKSKPLQKHTSEATISARAIATPRVTREIAHVPAMPAVMKPVVHRKRLVRNADVQSDSLIGFVSLPSAIGGVPLGSPYIIRTQMTAAQLSFAGLRVMAVNQQQQIDADVLVESDGMIRAIRLRQ